ncbi:hypothetical protein BH10CHL1_BH10CHL1_25690 [soil metagenome]
MLLLENEEAIGRWFSDFLDTPFSRCNTSLFDEDDSSIVERNSPNFPMNLVRTWLDEFEEILFS